MQVAVTPAMALRGAHQAAIAAASDGSVLINVAQLLPDEVHAQLSRALGASTLFIGVPLNEKDAAQVVARLDDAAAEAAAQLLGSRPKKRAKSRKPAAREGR